MRSITEFAHIFTLLRHIVVQNQYIVSNAILNHAILLISVALSVIYYI